MGVMTGIEWTDATWNPIRGCSRVSEGCRNCYAEKVAYRFSGAGIVTKAQPYAGLAHKVNGHAAWTGKVELAEKHLLDPLKWGSVLTGIKNGEGELRIKPHKSGIGTITRERPRRIFVNSMSDLFHENIPDEWIDRIFAVMALCPQHTFQVLTKRPERMLAYCGTRDRFPGHISTAIDTFSIKVKKKSILTDGDTFTWPLPNVQLGVSIEDQPTADARIPLLLQTPAAVRFISGEPLLGAVSLARWTDEGLECGSCGWSGTEDRAVRVDAENDWYACRRCGDECAHTPMDECLGGERSVDWVICGGESGPGARPMHPDWARSLRDQCQAASVPFFFKQWGEWLGTETVALPKGGWKLNLEKGIPLKTMGSMKLQMRWDGDRPRFGTKEDTLDSFMGDGSKMSFRVGKKAAGSLLDGVEWKQFPELAR